MVIPSPSPGRRARVSAECNVELPSSMEVSSCTRTVIISHLSARYHSDITVTLASVAVGYAAACNSYSNKISH